MARLVSLPLERKASGTQSALALWVALLAVGRLQPAIPDGEESDEDVDYSCD
jgi:hypothetical protein